MLKRRIFLHVSVTLMSLVLVAGCASTNPTGNGDPHENLNRKFYAFNDSLDKAVLEPVAKKYAAITPSPIRDGVTNVFDNISSVNTIANDLLQGKIVQFAQDTGRFVVNSSVGLGGIFDPASKIGLTRHDEDLGQTFGSWGAGEGAYLTLPFLGPSSYRDAASPAMGMLLSPLTYLAPFISVPVAAVNAINTRANLLSASRIRDQAALDPYTFVREAWRQQREFLIHDGNPPGDDFDEYIEGEGDAAILRIY